MNTIQIPVSAHVRKYIVAEYGPEPIYLTRKNDLGNLISNVMESVHLNINKLPKRADSMLAFELNSRFRKSFITEEKAKRLAYYFDQMFKKAFCRHINSFYRFGFFIEEGMEDFYKKYQIEECEYSRDSMRRYFDRYGRENVSEKEKKRPKISQKYFNDHVQLICTFRTQKLDLFKSTFLPEQNYGLTKRKALSLVRERRNTLRQAS